MESCGGCGAPLAPTWKFCIHCGVAVPASGSASADRGNPLVAPNNRLRNRLLLIGGIGIVLIGVALLVIAVTLFAGSSL